MKNSLCCTWLLALLLAFCLLKFPVRADEPVAASTSHPPLNLAEVVLMTGKVQRSRITGDVIDVHVAGRSRFAIKTVVLIPSTPSYGRQSWYARLTIDDCKVEEAANLIVKVKDKLFVPQGYGGPLLVLADVDEESAMILSAGKLAPAPIESLKVEIVPLSKSYKLGRPIQVELAVTNVGKKTLEFFYDVHSPRNYPWPYLQLTASGTRNREPISVNPQLFMPRYVVGTFVSLKPDPVLHSNSTLKRTIDMNRWLLFDRPGNYQIDLIYTAYITNPKADGLPQDWAMSYPMHMNIEITK